MGYVKFKITLTIALLFDLNTHPRATWPNVQEISMPIQKSISSDEEISIRLVKGRDTSIHLTCAFDTAHSDTGEFPEMYVQ